MPVSGRIRRRLALAIVLTALIPLIVAVLMARSAIRSSSERFFVPELGRRLDQSLGVYQELAKAVKASMRTMASAIAARGELRAAARQGDAAACRAELDAAFAEHASLVSLAVIDANGDELCARRRAAPLDPASEHQLEVLKSLQAGDDDAEEGARLVAVFATDKARFAELEELSEFVDAYRKVQKRSVEDAYLNAFALLLGITVLAAIGVGTLLARGVSTRIGRLADATRTVGAGDLSVRVPESGEDEIADLSRAFNRMLGEVESSRARIEYLQRIGAWQEMARRLAHEIKNPLTPIQLAVQELHRRYDGADPAYAQLVNTTLEVVEDEVGTLRRLVGEFSDFARLPRAELEPTDLAELLADQDASLQLSTGDSGVEVSVSVDARPANVQLDRQMFRRVLTNLVSNAAQAITGAGRGQGSVGVRLYRDAPFVVIDVVDDGPGIPEELRPSIFDPYVTTKSFGTGLGLAIAKKIVVEHGGSIEVVEGPSPGATLRIRLPDLDAPGGAIPDWRAPPSSGRSPRGAPQDAGSKRSS